MSDTETPPAADEPIQVLHARIVTGTGGGPEKTILESPRHLRDTRYRATACYLHPPRDPGFEAIRQRAAERDCPLVEVPDRFPVNPVVLFRLARLVRKLGIRVWHGHDYKTNFFGVLLRPWLRLRLVTTVHGWVKHTRRTPLYYAIDRWTLPRYDRVIAVSQDLYDQCLEAGVRKERLHLIENAIDADRFRRRGSPADAAGRSLPPGRLLIGAVGRLSDEKGFDLLIDALASLVDAGLDLELWIVGEGEEKDRLEQQATARGIGDRVRLLGFQADMLGLFECFDIFCLSSRREGLPNVVLEAQAMEIPVLATKSGGMEAFARDGEDALLVPTGSAAALAAGLRRLVEEPDLRGRLAAAARHRIEETCSFARRMERVVAVYDSLW